MACECEADKAGCLCIFQAGLHVGVTGGGTPADPITISVDAAYLQGANGLNTIVSVTGTGDVQNPYLVRIDVDSTVLDGYWTRWYGSRAALIAAGGVPPGTLAVVIPGA